LSGVPVRTDGARFKRTTVVLLGSRDPTGDVGIGAPILASPLIEPY
jgi:hypothetical protein